jgi:hypothetical protein
MGEKSHLRNSCVALTSAVICTSAVLMVSQKATSQLGTGKSFVSLQPTSPGNSQSGHGNISGTFRANSLYGNSLQLGSTANAGDVLTTDANGNGTWQPPQSGQTSTQRVYRWAAFNTYDQTGWAMDNDASLFGGVNPSSWTDNNATANMLSTNSDVLRTLLTQKGTIGPTNGMLFNYVYNQYSSTNGLVFVCLFRVKNTTGGNLVWTPWIKFSAYSAWSELASCALNGTPVWNSGTSGQTSFAISIPAASTNTVIFVSTSGIATPTTGGMYARTTRLGFYNNSLALPAGLEFVDDFDTMP